ncbi:polysaccharide export protein [bacterium]|nr:polysaccharide export protein [bacterium]
MSRYGRFRAGWLLLVLFTLAAAGCGSGGNRPVVRTNFIDFTPEQLRAIEHAGEYEYRLQPNDLLRVAFANEPNLLRDPVLILPDGAVTLVGVDRIKVAGLTITEADSVITDAYAKEYRDPQISVVVLESRGRRVYVLGEVVQPGMVDLAHGGLDILGAIAQSGGFTEHAAKDGAVLVRVTSAGYMVRELDLSNFHTLAFSELATVDLLPYDVIYVPRTRIGDFAYFARSVLTGVVNITRIASDMRYLSDGGIGRF